MDGLVHNLDSRTLWNEFGIDDNIIVGYLIIISIQHSSLMTRSQPFTSDFPRGNIYQMISPDLLHQVIKGTFKDHLVTWICEYLVIQHGERRAGVILDDIDRRYVLHTTLTTHIEIVADLLVELLRCHLFRVSADFPMVGASSSGQGMTPRL
jgi:Plavaka transposase